jgi:hypothetical protein
MSEMREHSARRGAAIVSIERNDIASVSVSYVGAALA